MPKHPTPSNAVEAAYSHLDELETVLRVFEDTGKALETSAGRLNTSHQMQLRQLGLNPVHIKGNLQLLNHIVHGIEVMHKGTVALTAEECAALTQAPKLFKRCVSTLAVLSKPNKPHFLSFLLNKQILEKSTSALSTLTRLSDVFTHNFCSALQHYDDAFALRKGHTEKPESKMLRDLVQKTDTIQ